MQTINNKRDQTIDILKGLCIILMIAGHASCPATDFFYLFHMSVFFMASGYFFKPSTIYDIKSFLFYCKKKLLSLWLPYVIYNSIFVLFRHQLFLLNIITTNENIVNYGSLSSTSSEWSLKHTIHKLFDIFFMQTYAENIMGAFWFVAVLLYIQIIFAFITLIINKYNKTKSLRFYILIYFSISCLTLFISCLEKTKTPLSILYCPLFFLGFLINKINIKQYICTSPTKDCSVYYLHFL